MRDELEALVLKMYRSGITYAEAVCQFKKRFILTVLEDAGGNQCKAARELRMHRNTLSRTIVDLELNIKDLRRGTRRPPRSAHTVPLGRKVVR